MKIAFLLCFISLSLFAHKLNLFLEQEKSKLYIYSYFNSGSACKNCKLELFDKDEKLIKSLKTDEQGEYYLEDFKEVAFVKVEAIGGHSTKERVDKAFIEAKDKKEQIKKEDSFLQSIISIVLIIMIFIALKRVRR